ncbi:phytanoyl-CoA dioxygenase family protein [Rheinheimera baltica]|uniref:Phytanoyl-CoA dioxygenase family protein n=1 Tax=Rheinheimera baltica TaxID=67576 RepID=A0ABT9I5L0_9GAMM|nr:phytanoyl-CoA dioxygenase family protein [Rheinheimera baltica]MDP5138701.1 phytanoyl-CoA dioxygenase family protein [Rheinheimera baltica]MDP5149735.1 phytanoyl-CoA dioxygenase family protein [Rheinheimera baltica]
MKKIFSRNQHFSDPLLGHTGLNKAGLHLLRLNIATWCFNWRRMLRFRFEHYKLLRQFQRQGFLSITHFLPNDQFIALQQEVHECIARKDMQHPIGTSDEQGFGKKQFFDGGFDRFDGTTLNRFYDIDSRTPILNAFKQNSQLLRLLSCLTGMNMNLKQLQLYKVVHGAELGNPDIQKDWHRDTFQPAVKMWYFTDEVTDDNGPFEYLPGTQRMSNVRQRWEYQQSVAAAAKKAGGSFRIGQSDACDMYNTKPERFTVPANTLVLADIRGFHRRGTGRPGAERISLYANFRPHPFKIW